MADNNLVVAQAETIKDPEPVARISSVHELYEQRKDVVCFTPAPLVVVGKLPVDPARDFISRFSVPRALQPFCLALAPTARPFFRGLGCTTIDGEVIDWDRRIYAVPQAGAEACFDFLSGIGVHGDGYFASAAQHEINLPDPLSLFTRRVIPVQVFGVLTGDYIFYLAEHLTDQPYLSRTPAAPHVQQNFKLNPHSNEISQKLKDVL